MGRYALIIKENFVNNVKYTLKQEIVQYFTVKGSGTNPTEPIPPTPVKVDFKEILKDYRGGRTDFERKNYKQKELRGNVFKYKKDEYKNAINTFDKKYRSNPEYADITDPFYYMKMPGITIDYSKVNTDMTFKGVDELVGIDNGNKISTEPKDFQCDYEEIHQFIWRTDVEKETLDYINLLRKKKNLKPLKASTDLTSIAKYAANRNFIDSAVNNITHTSMASARTATETFYYPNDSQIVGARDNKVKHRPVYCEWSDGIPCAFKNDSKNKKYFCERCETKDVLKELNYNKKVNFLFYDSFLWSNGREMIDYMLKGSMETGKMPVLGNNIECYRKDIRDIIFKKDITEIGIGSTYALPHNILELNGHLGMTIMTQ